MVSFFGAQVPQTSFFTIQNERAISQGGKIIHTAAPAKSYDSRRLPQSRPYLQCCLALPELLAGGVVSFPSGAPQVYYKLLLATKKQVEPGLSAKEYRRQLALLQGDEVAIAALDRGPPRKRPRVEAADENNNLQRYRYGLPPLLATHKNTCFVSLVCGLPHTRDSRYRCSLCVAGWIGRP